MGALRELLANRPAAVTRLDRAQVNRHLLKLVRQVSAVCPVVSLSTARAYGGLGPSIL